MILFIDDMRSYAGLRSGYVARSFGEAKEALIRFWGELDEIYLGHDLGGGDTETGYDLLRFIEEITREGGLWAKKPVKITLITGNPAGRRRMEQVLESLHKLWEPKLL